MTKLALHESLPREARKINETVTVSASIDKEQSVKLQEGYYDEPTFTIPKIEAIHAGVTRNNTVYPAHELKGDPAKGTGVYSWTQPYPKPVIFNHDWETEATGRVIHAEFSESTQAGRPGIVVYPKITSKEAVQAILDGRLMTVSIGGESEKVTCSICQTNMMEEGFCGHYKGEVYEGQTCNWIYGDIKFDELSWVNVPADSDAMVVDTESSLLIASESTPTESAQTLHNSDFAVSAEGIVAGVLPPNDESSVTVKTDDTAHSKTLMTEGVEKLDQEQMRELAKMVAGILGESTKPVVEEPETATEETHEEPVVTEEPVAADPVVETPSEPEQPVEEQPVTDEPEAGAEADSAEESDLAAEVEALKDANEALKQEVAELQDGLKDTLEEAKATASLCLEKLLDPEAFEEMASALKEMTYDEIKAKVFEQLDHMLTQQISESTQQRTVTKVVNPATSGVEDFTETKKTITEKDKIMVFKKMLQN